MILGGIGDDREAGTGIIIEKRRVICGKKCSGVFGGYGKAVSR